MALTKVLKASFGNENIKYFWGDSPIFKIKEELKQYISPQETSSYDLQIPSISGGRLIMTESTNGKIFSNPKADFYYLPNADDLEKRTEVTNIIIKHGLEIIPNKYINRK